MFELLLVVLACTYAPFLRFYLHLCTVCAFLRRKKHMFVYWTMCAFFQLNPPLAEEIHLWWMKSLRDETCLAAGDGGGFNFI
jgi:hypothetical protein